MSKLGTNLKVFLLQVPHSWVQITIELFRSNNKKFQNPILNRTKSYRSYIIKSKPNLKSQLCDLRFFKTYFQTAIGIELKTITNTNACYSK